MSSPHWFLLIFALLTQSSSSINGAATATPKDDFRSIMSSSAFKNDKLLFTTKYKFGGNDALRCDLPGELVFRTAFYGTTETMAWHIVGTRTPGCIRHNDWRLNISYASPTLDCSSAANGEGHVVVEKPTEYLDVSNCQKRPFKNASRPMLLDECPERQQQKQHSQRRRQTTSGPTSLLTFTLTPNEEEICAASGPIRTYPMTQKRQARVSNCLITLEVWLDKNEDLLKALSPGKCDVYSMMEPSSPSPSEFKFTQSLKSVAERAFCSNPADCWVSRPWHLRELAIASTVLVAIIGILAALAISTACFFVRRRQHRTGSANISGTCASPSSLATTENSGSSAASGRDQVIRPPPLLLAKSAAAGVWKPNSGSATAMDLRHKTSAELSPISFAGTNTPPSSTKSSRLRGQGQPHIIQVYGSSENQQNIGNQQQPNAVKGFTNIKL